jgi:hypothetical protein
MDAAQARTAETLTANYQLDAPSREITLKVGGGRYQVTHRLRRPKYAQLKEREARIRNEAITVSKEEIRSIYSEREANAWLWDEVATDVKGYDIGDGDSETWREVSGLRQAIPSAHKIAAVDRYYAVSARLAPVEEGGEGGRGFRLIGGAEIDVSLEIGADETPEFIVGHKLRTPQEGEWNKYLASNSEVREVRTPGSREKARRVKVIRNLHADVELYNSIFLELSGAVVQGAPYTPDKRDLFLAEIDPLHKQVIIQAVSESFAVELGN